MRQTTITSYIKETQIQALISGIPQAPIYYPYQDILQQSKKSSV
jgi:hypothetical protein